VHRIATLSTLTLLFSLLAIPGLGVRYLEEFEYPPLESQPSAMVVDDAGGIWLALPEEGSVARYVPEAGLRIVDLGFKATDLVYAHGVVAAFQPGSSEIAFVDAARSVVTWRSSEAGLIDDVVAVSGSFVLVKSFPTMSLLVQLTPKGEAIWENMIADKVLERNRVAAGSDEYVWLRTSEGSLLVVELGREGYKEFRMEKKPVLLASREGKVWAVDPEGGVTRISIRGVEARVNTGFTARLGDYVFALPSNRLAILSRIENILVEISGDRVSKEQLQVRFLLAAMRGSSSIVLLDASEKRVLVASLSRPPVISDASAQVLSDGQRIQVRARVSDPDEDLASGYPRAAALLGTQVVSTEMSREGEIYTAELAVPVGDGALRVYVQALDLGGNDMRLDVASFEVMGGKVVGSGSVQPPPQPQPSTGISEILPLAVEMAFFVILVTTLTLFWVSRARSRGKKRRR